MEQLRAFVLKTARDLLAGDIHNGLIDFRFRIDAEDGAGHIVYSMPFKHAINIIPE
jgi:predicted ATP-grasp superfamily ATP-dependent carboligase